ncbi:nucleoside-diphosphate sugar epimerase/dehydratase [Simiduia litorea]
MLMRSIVALINGGSQNTTNVIVYGAGETGCQLVRSLGATNYHAVAFVDDNPTIQGSVIYGLKVYNPKKAQELIVRYNAKITLLALGGAGRNQKSKIIKQLEDLGTAVKTIPPIHQIVEGTAKISDLQDVSIEDLLGREPVAAEPKLLSRCIKNKVVMVTGAGGSIGSELTRQILNLKPAKLILFEISEFSLYTIEQELIQNCKAKGSKCKTEIIPILGSVQNLPHLKQTMRTFQPNTIYHAAAYKHVPMVEHNIVEGVKNNIFGTWNCAQAAIDVNADSFVLVSTDKAVRPTNVMGTTKRIAELVLQALAKHQNKTRFTMVRFGNVLGSSGSVVPLFRKQIKSGGPITVTHPDIIRYFMTIPEAAELVIQAGSMGMGGDVFVLDMGEPVKIADLAVEMIKLSGLTVCSAENPNGDIAIEYSGLRPGEKLYEELLIGDNVSGTEHKRIMRAEEKSLSWKDTEALLTALNSACAAYDGVTIKQLLLDAPTDYVGTLELVDPLSKQNLSITSQFTH